MSWFADNWIWVFFLVGFIAMHLFGHGGHGGHGGHRGHAHREDPDDLSGSTSKGADGVALGDVKDPHHH